MKPKNKIGGVCFKKSTCPASPPRRSRRPLREITNNQSLLVHDQLAVRRSKRSIRQSAKRKLRKTIKAKADKPGCSGRSLEESTLTPQHGMDPVDISLMAPSSFNSELMSKQQQVEEDVSQLAVGKEELSSDNSSVSELETKGSCSQANVDEPDFVGKSQLPADFLSEISKCGEALMPANCDLCTIQIFDVNKRTFQGEWKFASNDILLEVKNQLGSGGFRDCYAAEVKNLPPECDCTCSPSGWVVKFYKEKREELIEWSDCCKDVQAQSIARKLCEIFRYLTNSLDDFGTFPRMNPSYLVSRKGMPLCFTIEPRIDLSKEAYCKFINNDGLPTSNGQNTELGEKCLAFSHWTYQCTGGRFLLCDLQGTKDLLTDVQIASPDGGLFGPGNFGKKAFVNFTATHKCNNYCHALKLKDVADEYCKADCKEEELKEQSCEDPVMDVKDDLRKMKIKEDLFSMTNYLESRDDITPQLRTFLIYWMMKLKESRRKFSEETLHLAVKILDHYVKGNVIDRDDLLLVGATTLIIASEVKEPRPLHVKDLVHICWNSYDFVSMKRRILRSLEFDINIPTPYEFLRKYERAAKVNVQTQSKAHFLLESALLESSFIIYKASYVAASCLYLAMLMNDCDTELWTPTLAHYTGYTKKDLQNCVFQLHSMNNKLPNIDES